MKRTCMKKYEKYLAAFITAFLCIGYIIYYMTVEEKGSQYAMLGGAIVVVTEILVFGLIGLLLLPGRRTRSVGQGILLGTAVSFVVGFGLCSSL
jgi:hypothetical protein